MAVILIKQWGLAELRVSLDLAGAAATVVAELWLQVDDERSRRWHSTFAPAEFGLGEAGRPPAALRVPDRLVTEVTSAIGDQNARQTAIWLRLVPHYGQLGAVPWEQALLAAGELPVLRVPERLPVATDPGRTWTAAVAVCAPAGATWAAEHVGQLLAALPQQVHPELAVDVFADAGTVDQLRRAGVPSWATVHDPRAEQLRRPRAGRADQQVGSPGRKWADWIIDGLAGRAVRAVHLVLDGGWDGDRAMLAVSPDPAEPVPRSGLAFIPADEALALADATGAATLSFGSPPDNPADPATRVIADLVGRQRSGATVYAALAGQPQAAALAATWRFLAAPERNRFVPDPSQFAYLQPELLARSQPDPDAGRNAVPDQAQPALPDGYRPAARSISEVYADAAAVPSWAAGADRYVTTELDKLIRADATLPDGGLEVTRAYNRGGAEALSEIQDMVARHAGPA